MYNHRDVFTTGNKLLNCQPAPETEMKRPSSTFDPSPSYTPPPPPPSPSSISSSSSSSSLHSFLSGAGAGVVSSILCCPLDVAKVRIQVQGTLGIHRYTSTFHTLKLIMKEEGIQGCFRGLGPALCNVPLFWSIYFFSYDQLKMKLGATFPSTSHHMIHLYSAITAGAIGGKE